MALGIITAETNIKLLKEMWPQKMLDYMFYREHFFAAAVPKEGGFVGTPGALHNVVPINPPTGVSRTFTDARANRGTGDEVDFIVRRKRLFGVLEIDNEVIAASESEQGAIVRILREKSEKTLEYLGRRHARSLHGNEGGALARVSAIGVPSAGPNGGTVFTLQSAADVVAFERDQTLIAAATDGTSGAPRAGTMRVLAVDRNISGTATIELTNPATGDGTLPAGWTTLDYLFVIGDFGLSYTGLGAWLPTDRSSLATPFLGVPRSLDPERLAGVYEDFRGASISEAIKRLATRVRINGGGTPDIALLNPLDYEVLDSEIESTVRRTEVTVRPSGKRGAAIGFEGIEIRSGNSRVMCFEDIDAPRGVVRVLERKTWVFRHLREIGHWATEGMAGRSRASENADAQELRCRTWGNLVCKVPGRNGVGLIGS